jgi:ABC-type transport system involved in cytochrome bd biosynthesis fused ATPase/permease subunit
MTALSDMGCNLELFRKHLEFSLATYFMLLALCVAAPIFAVSGYLITTEATRQKAELNARLLNVAKQTMAGVDLKIQKIMGVAQTLARLPLTDKLEIFDEAARAVANE